MAKERCSRCGYDLREHDLHEHCPECNAAVALVYKEHPWWSGEMQVVLRRGLAWIAGSLGVLLLGGIARISLQTAGVPVLMVLWGLVQQALWLHGVQLATQYRHREVAVLRPWMRLAAGWMTAGVLALCVAPMSPTVVPGLWVTLARLLAWIAILLSCACLAAWLAMLARLMRMRRYMYPFLIVATASATIALLGGAGLFAGLITAGEKGLWTSVALTGPVLFCGPLLVWLLILCVTWGRVLHKENVALGLAR